MRKRLSFRAVDVSGVGPVLVAEGVIDCETCGPISAAFTDLIRRGQLRVVMDCAGVKYMNGVGLGVFVKYAGELKERGGGITLVGVHAKLRIVIDMLGLAPMFTEVRAARLVLARSAPVRVTLTPRPSGRTGVALLEVVGSIDEETAEAELVAIPEAARRGELDVILDGEGLLALEGRGLDILVRRARSLADLGGSVALLGVSRELKAALEASGLERAFSAVCLVRPRPSPLALA